MIKVQLQNLLFYPAVGGIENYLYYVAKTLLKMGYRPQILCAKHKVDLPSKEIYENIEIIRHPVYKIPKIISTLTPIYYTKKIQEFLENNIKDIDVIWSRHPYYTYASCKLEQKAPVIYIQATVFPLYVAYNYSKNLIKKNKSIFSKFTQLLY